MKIKILSWNVRGLNDREKRKLLKLVIRSQKAYLVCLIETKMQEMSLKVVKSLGVGRFLDWGVVDARRASKGILIFWNNIVLDLLELECGGFTISGRFRNVEDGLFGYSLVSMVQSSQGKKRTFGMSWVQLKVCGTILGV